MNSYFQDIELHVVKHLRSAKSRILIAVAWFTNPNIGIEIIKKKNLDIEVIVDDNKINRTCNILNELNANNIDLTFIKDLNKNYYLMHNKFCVIDNKTVITGSYNWTQNANSNDENISIFTDSITAAHYSQEFRRIKNIKFPNDSIFISDKEIDEITDSIYQHILEIIRQNIDGLSKGLITKWKDEKIKNKLRAVNERLRNSIHSKVGHFGIYNELIGKYGFNYNTLATDEEKAESRDTFNKKGLDEVDFYLHKEFQFFKIKAIRKLQDNYAKLLEKSGTDMTKIERVFKVFNFITVEKRDMAEEIKITSI